MTLVLDTGALIAVDKADRGVIALLVQARAHGETFVIPGGVIGQAWRNGRTQVRLARFLSSSGLRVEPLDDFRARQAGQLCGATGTSDVVDASVVVAARQSGAKVVTSDPKDLARLDPNVELIEI